MGGHVTAVVHCPVGVDAERIERESMSVISSLLLQLSIYGFIIKSLLLILYVT